MSLATNMTYSVDGRQPELALNRFKRRATMRPALLHHIASKISALTRTARLVVYLLSMRVLTEATAVRPV